MRTSNYGSKPWAQPSDPATQLIESHQEFKPNLLNGYPQLNPDPNTFSPYGNDDLSIRKKWKKQDNNQPMYVMIDGKGGIVKHISWYSILDFSPCVAQYLGDSSTWCSHQVWNHSQFLLESQTQQEIVWQKVEVAHLLYPLLDLPLSPMGRLLWQWVVTHYLFYIRLDPSTATKVTSLAGGNREKNIIIQFIH